MTSRPHLALLPDRGVISVTGEDAAHFLDNLITNDMDHLAKQPAIHAALLSPQGKILFAFFVVKLADGLLLETARQSVAELLKRFGIYRLRAKVALNDLSASRAVIASWGGEPPAMPLAVSYPDPRAPGLGWRHVMAPEMAAKLAAENEGVAAYDRHRIALGIPEAGRDYLLGDTFPHEANLDRQAGVSFSKGCFVGQEVVARMQHKTVVRKRIVRVAGSAPLTEGSDIRAGEAVIGRIGTADGTRALATLRLDRAAEARGKGQSLTGDGVTLEVDPTALDAFAEAIATQTAGRG